MRQVFREDLKNIAENHKKDLRDSYGAAVAIVRRRAHHAGQALIAMRASEDIFINKLMMLTANYRPEIHLAVCKTGRRLTLRFIKQLAPFYPEIKRSIPTRCGPPGVSR